MRSLSGQKQKIMYKDLYEIIVTEKNQIFFTQELLDSVVGKQVADCIQKTRGRWKLSG